MSHRAWPGAIILLVIILVGGAYWYIPRLLNTTSPTPTGVPSETYSVSGVVDYFHNGVLRVRYQSTDPVSHVVENKLVAVPVTALTPISRITVANDQVIRTQATSSDLTLGTKVILYSGQDLRVATNPQLKRIDILNP